MFANSFNAVVLLYIKLSAIALVTHQINETFALICSFYICTAGIIFLCIFTILFFYASSLSNKLNEYNFAIKASFYNSCIGILLNTFFDIFCFLYHLFPNSATVRYAWQRDKNKQI